MSPDVLPTVQVFIKILVLLSLCIYAVFAFVMVRQEHLMATVLEETFEPVLRLLTFIHLLLSIGLIIAAALLL